MKQHLYTIAAEAAKINYIGPKPEADSIIKGILFLVFGVLGALSVIVLIIAGIRLVISGDNPDTVAKTRSTIIYAAIGLVVAVSAGAIVQLVTGFL